MSKLKRSDVSVIEAVGCLINEWLSYDAKSKKRFEPPRIPLDDHNKKSILTCLSCIYWYNFTVKTGDVQINEYFLERAKINRQLSMNPFNNNQNSNYANKILV